MIADWRWPLLATGAILAAVLLWLSLAIAGNTGWRTAGLLASGVIMGALPWRFIALRRGRAERLEAVLRGIREGVILCDEHGTILFCNPAVKRILGDNRQIRPGGSLYGVWTQRPVEQTLQLLRRRCQRNPRADRLTEFVCATRDDGLLLHCRMSLLPSDSIWSSCFLLSFDDIGRQTHALGRRDRSLREAITALRAPLASLRAAAENVALEKDLSDDDRQLFEAMIVRESRELSRRFDYMASESEVVIAAPFSMADIHSSDLLASIRLRRGPSLPRLMEHGEPCWLHAETHSLSLILDHLLSRLRQEHGVRAALLQVRPGDRRVYLECLWRGRPIATAVLEHWLTEPLCGISGSTNTRDVLERHDSTAWSRRHPSYRDAAQLTIPLPAARHQRERLLQAG